MKFHFISILVHLSLSSDKSFAIMNIRTIHSKSMKNEKFCTFFSKVLGCLVQVFDATNTTIERRRLIREIIVDKMGYKLFFVESLCDDPSIVESNIRQVKINSPDYADMNNEDALKDFLMRINHYHDRYQTLNEIEEKSLSFMKIFNTGQNYYICKKFA